MPENNVTDRVSCPRCGAGTSAELLARFAGSCPRCLLAFTLSEDLPEFPQLDVLETVGRGGMGVVYRARQVHLGRIVALKILSPDLPYMAELTERISQEAGALARLQHPNIVSLYDSGVHG